ncbi:hypothetical protein JXR93_08045 [bacterium]|nr:hypothetical protein [bacterium]
MGLKNIFFFSEMLLYFPEMLLYFPEMLLFFPEMLIFFPPHPKPLSTTWRGALKIYFSFQRYSSPFQRCFSAFQRYISIYFYLYN